MSEAQFSYQSHFILNTDAFYTENLSKACWIICDKVPAVRPQIPDTYKITLSYIHFGCRLYVKNLHGNLLHTECFSNSHSQINLHPYRFRCCRHCWCRSIFFIQFLVFGRFSPTSSLACRICYYLLLLIMFSVGKTSQLCLLCRASPSSSLSLSSSLFIRHLSLASIRNISVKSLR